MFNRGPSSKSLPINIVGSSIFGRYPKISTERTFNMFISDNWMVPYSGYQVGIAANKFRNGLRGRGCFNSTKLDRLVVVIDDNVFLTQIQYNQTYDTVTYSSVVPIGVLQTNTGVVYITENNNHQIAISDGQAIYIWDSSSTGTFTTVSTPSFVPGYITFHDTYFICAASQDDYPVGGPLNNTWRLSAQNDGTSWPNDSASIGFLQSKPDNTQAVVRFPSKGNMIFVMGSITTEAWFNTGAQLFPYQRNNQFNIDYGCLSPATVAYMDEIVVWLAANEKSGPIIMYSDGGMPHKITTDGIDYQFSQLQNPEDSQAFLIRQDGHLFYQITFYTDNFTYVVDFLPDGSHKIYNLTDQNLNYYIASEMAYFNNQYYFVSKNTGNLYVFDTIFTTYQDSDKLGNLFNYEIPRIRSCANIRNPEQDYFIINDIGFTIETGETNYQQQNLGPIYLITQDGQTLVTQGTVTGYLETQDGMQLVDQTGLNDFVTNQTFPDDIFNLIAQQPDYVYTTPRVDLSLSYDGGASFGNDQPYVLNPIGLRKNRLNWWQGGMSNDIVPMFKMWGMGRFVITDGVVNIRT